MIAYLESHDLFDVSIGAGEEHYEEKNDWLTNCYKAYGIMCMAVSPMMNYLIDYVDYPFELWINLDRYFGVQKEEDDTYNESNTSSSVLPSNVSASIVSDEVIHDEEMKKSSTRSI